MTELLSPRDFSGVATMSEEVVIIYDDIASPTVHVFIVCNPVQNSCTLIFSKLSVVCTLVERYLNLVPFFVSLVETI